MKKNIGLIILLSLFSISFNTINVEAETSKNISVTTEYENNFKIETIIIEDFNITRANNKSGTKTVNYYNGNTLLWSVSVRGSFSYTGSSSACTSATLSAYSNNSEWKLSNQSSRRSGNTAYASATGTKYFLGLALQTVSRDVSLKCSPSGVLS